MTVIDRARNKLRAVALERLLRTAPRSDMIRLGSDYGGWWVPETLLGPDSVCYLAGAGEDITFDVALMERFGCAVVSVDPTPRAIIHVKQHAPAQGYHFLPVGLGADDGSHRFYAPADPSHVSHSMVNLQHTDDFFDAEIRSLPSLMAEFGHDHIDLLKMDIEGAEVMVLDSMLREDVLPTVVCVEFDVRSLPRILQCARRLRSVGYEAVRVERFNVTFVRQ